MMSPESLPWPYLYPKAEHYESPASPHEQVDEELRVYETPAQLRVEVAALRLSYQKTAFMQSVKELSMCAAAVRSPESSVSSKNFNGDFFSGALVALHVNIAPASEELQSYVLRARFTPDTSNDADEDLVALQLTEVLEEWAADGERSWSAFYESQSKDYQKRAMALSQRMYADKEDFVERELDFIMGYTFASNMVWTIGLSHRSKNPV